jgi:hypothetical protein
MNAINKSNEDGHEFARRPTKQMFHIEKFLPPECPKCRAPFKQQNTDWNLLLGDIVDGEKVIRETSGYDIIICAHCENYTARYPLESYTLSSKKKAEELVAREGFVNLQQVTGFGTHTKDMHVVVAKESGMRVMSVGRREKLAR